MPMSKIESTVHDSPTSKSGKHTIADRRESTSETRWRSLGQKIKSDAIFRRTSESSNHVMLRCGGRKDRRQKQDFRKRGGEIDRVEKCGGRVGREHGVNRYL